MHVLLLVLAILGHKPDPAITRALNDSVAAWNHGDLERFMDGYWKSPELEFYSNSSATRGWQETLDRYKARYSGEGREMGTLSFNAISIRMLSDDAAFVVGHWTLTMKNGKTPNGNFTLLFRKIGGKWKIVVDHSSGE